MAARGVPMPLAVITCLLAVIFLLDSMFLLSSIIAWISVEFSGPLPHALCFILGILSLINSIALILRVGLAGIGKILSYILCLTCSITLLASLALFIPWIVEYSSFCEDCSESEETNDCIENCDDECCFTGTSRPLAINFIFFSLLTLLGSCFGIGVALLYIKYSKVDSSSSTSKKR